LQQLGVHPRRTRAAHQDEGLVTHRLQFDGLGMAGQGWMASRQYQQQLFHQQAMEFDADGVAHRCPENADFQLAGGGTFGQVTGVAFLEREGNGGVAFAVSADDARDQRVRCGGRGEADAQRALDAFGDACGPARSLLHAGEDDLGLFEKYRAAGGQVHALGVALE